MRPYLEHLPVSPDSSLSMLNRRLHEAIPFQWHHHPEYELTLTLNSRGQRFIGDHVGEYDHGDLVLIGPNLPHTWSSRAKRDETAPHVALVLWFRQEWIDRFLAQAVEFAPITRLFASAGSALAFSPDAGLAFSGRFERLFSLTADRRLMAVLDLLCDLAAAGSRQTLASTTPPVTGESRSRIDRVLDHLHRHYAGAIRIEELAELAALSHSAVHRMFFKHTRTTVSAYVARLRIGEACARLSGTTQPISHIAAEVGYANLANFNRQFRALRGMTPRDYRSAFSG